MERCYAIVLVALLVALSSCSGDSEELSYSIPSELCGMQIDRSLYEPIFPSGEKLEVSNYNDRRPDGTTSPNGGCGLAVDGKSALGFYSDGSEQSIDLSSYIDERGYDLAISDSQSIRGSTYSTRVWPTMAMAVIKCSSSRYDYAGIAIWIDIDWTDSDLTAELKRVADSYIEDRFDEIDPSACRVA